MTTTDTPDHSGSIAPVPQTAAGSSNAALVAANFARFATGDVRGARATWADDAVWHILDVNRFEGEYTVDEYFDLLTGPWQQYTQDYELRVQSIVAYGDHLVVVHVESTGDTPDGPIDGSGGLMIYRFTDGRIVEGWAVSKGSDAITAF